MAATGLIKAVNGNLKTIGVVVVIILGLGPGWFWAGAKSGQINELARNRIEDIARQIEVDRAQDGRLDASFSLMRQSLGTIQMYLDDLRDEIHTQNATIAALNSKLEAYLEERQRE